jgi:hypothetical protein
MSLPPDRYVPALSGLGAASPLEEAVLLRVGVEASIGPTLEFSARPLAQRYLELIEDARR